MGTKTPQEVKTSHSGGKEKDMVKSETKKIDRKVEPWYIFPTFFYNPMFNLLLLSSPLCPPPNCGTKPGYCDLWHQIIHFPTSLGVSECGASKWLSSASDQAKGRASGPVLTSRFLAVLNHSVLLILSFPLCPPPFFSTGEGNPLLRRIFTESNFGWTDQNPSLEYRWTAERCLLHW